MSGEFPYEPRVSVSIGRKLTDNNYGNVDLWMGISGIEPGATEEEMEELLATGDRAFNFLRKNMAAKIKEIKDKRFSYDN